MNISRHSPRNSGRIVCDLQVSESERIVPVRLALGFNLLESPDGLIGSIRDAILQKIMALKASGMLKN